MLYGSNTINLKIPLAPFISPDLRFNVIFNYTFDPIVKNNSGNKFPAYSNLALAAVLLLCKAIEITGFKPVFIDAVKLCLFVFYGYWIKKFYLFNQYLLVVI